MHQDLCFLHLGEVVAEWLVLGNDKFVEASTGAFPFFFAMVDWPKTTHTGMARPVFILSSSSMARVGQK